MLSCLIERRPDTMPFVEAAVRRKPGIGAAEVPFAPHAAGIALLR
jgi:hypothetical protein